MPCNRALIAILLVGALLFSGNPMRGAAPAGAQEAGALGTAVPVTNDEGVPVGSVTVTEVTDPFTAFNPDYPAEAGSRYVAATVAFDSDAGQRFDIAPWTIVLQDDQGFLWDQASVYLPDDALVPELSSETLAPGSRITGVVGFVLPDDRIPARVSYQPESSRMIVLADLLGQPAPELGDTVGLPDSEGGAGSVVVTEITDPLMDLDPSQAPPDGARFVQATLVYENTSEGRFSIEPYSLLMRDANGTLWTSTSVSRLDESALVPDLTGAQLAPGDRLSGAAVFAIPEGVDVAGLYAQPVSGQLVQLADLQGAATDDSAASPAAGTNGADGADAGESSSSAGLASDDCAALDAWLSAARERIARAGAMSVEDATLGDPEALAAHATEYAALAAEQVASAPPPDAVAANKALAATLNAYSGAIRQILEADDSGKDPAVELAAGMNTFNAAGTRVHAIEDELARIAGVCAA